MSKASLLNLSDTFSFLAPIAWSIITLIMGLLSLGFFLIAITKASPEFRKSPSFKAIYLFTILFAFSTYFLYNSLNNFAFIIKTDSNQLHFFNVYKKPIGTLNNNQHIDILGKQTRWIRSGQISQKLILKQNNKNFTSVPFAKTIDKTIQLNKMLN